ncbi:MAG TPA: divergent polysaccharide deacetylase family protein, partial [Candidatus Edwardsbacteria bacterium]|nr:divergent polysaccharide deacetylase family protein [Candidatus Edwardsbacteria bacterium]
MPTKRRSAKAWFRIPLLLTVALLLALAGYRTYHRWGPLLSGAGRRPTRRQIVSRFCGQIVSLSTGAFAVKRLPDRERSRLVVNDSRGQPLVQTNLDLCRLAETCGLRTLAATEDRRRARLSLVFGMAADSLVWVEVQRKQPPEALSPVRPRLALAAYALPPENSRAWQALLRRTAIRTLITDQPLRTAVREVLVALPLEPIGYPKQDPGPGTLLLDDGETQLRTKLTRFSKYAPRPVGFAASQGSRALKEQRLTTVVMRFCAAGGLLFLEPRFTANSLARESAR